MVAILNVKQLGFFKTGENRSCLGRIFAIMLKLLDKLALIGNVFLPSDDVHLRLSDLLC